MTPAYLGDGVYVSDDGYQLWLSVGHHTNQVVALDREVFTALVQHGSVFYGMQPTQDTPNE